ncbi:unnamed protein product [Arctia plantaginis]|uniref:Scavenger receptor class B member 1 n=1 Tax=Arctia plantaginis TaxID=874455 RepID=A0A8S0ZJR5_ARCPL|nr:unnamed protein product [Arctia plantaginis]
MSEGGTIPEDCTTSSSGSVRSEDSDLTKHSATDSLNSLLKNKETFTDDCTDTCMDMKVECEGEGESKRRTCCYPIVQCVWGVLLILLSIGSFIFTPLDFMLHEKLNMRPGLPPYEWWIDPPDEVKLRAYVFNITNHERFLQGLDEKLNVQEIGPVVYLEKLLHSNVTFNDNSTMTYTAKRFPIYLPDENQIDLNATITVPNVAVLGMMSYLYNYPYIVRALFRGLVNLHRAKPFVNRTIYEYLWNFKDPVLEASSNLAPGLVPVNNAGMLDRIYADFKDEMTVKIGPQWGHEEFFQINRFRGVPQLPGFDPDTCPDRIFGSTEGVMYAQRLTKQAVLQYWRKTVCKLMPLYFDSELTIDNVPLYRYNLSESAFDRITNRTDCYDSEPSLPAGISDASKCYFNFPMVVSFPHFYTGGLPKDYYVTGLKPDRLKHNSWVDLEPYTGTPFRAVARLQSNLRVQDLSSYNSNFAKLSNQVVPLFWAEYNQGGLPDGIKWTIFFIVVILPPFSLVLSISMLLFGLYLLAKNLYMDSSCKHCLKAMLLFKSNNASQNKILTFESETFLKAR